MSVDVYINVVLAFTVSSIGPSCVNPRFLALYSNWIESQTLSSTNLAHPGLYPYRMSLNSHHVITILTSLVMTRDKGFLWQPITQTLHV